MTPLKLRTIKREELGRREMISHRTGEDTCNTLKKSKQLNREMVKRPEETLHKIKVHKANKHIKRCSTLVEI